MLPLEPRVQALQKAYIRKVIDTVQDLPNVLYEVANESSGGGSVDEAFRESTGLSGKPYWGDSTEWQYRVITFVKQYETDKGYTKHLVGMTMQFPVPEPSRGNACLSPSSSPLGILRRAGGDSPARTGIQEGGRVVTQNPLATPKIGLGIDAGGSCTRWLLVDTAGRELGRGEGAPIMGQLVQARDRVELAEFHQVIAAAARVARPHAVVAGITGVHAATDAADLFQAEAAGALGLQPLHVKIVNDMDIAYASVFAPGEGVLVYAGTGSVGYHVRVDGSVVSVGGHGLVDDAGAGYWIGREGLKQTLRRTDELGHPSQERLAQEIYHALGSTSWPKINQCLYQDGRGHVAALAPAVHRAAQQKDGAAIRILAEAGRELARLATVLLTRVGELPVALAGGTVAAGPLLTQAFAASLPVSVPWQVAPLNPAGAAANLALTLGHPAVGGSAVEG